MNPASSTRRNDPCPCGSGRRYKHCHGALGMAEAATARALAQRGDGDLAGALATLGEALASSPESAVLLNLQGLVRMESRDLDGAAASLEQAIALDPAFADAHFNLGILHLVRGDYPGGWREYEWRTRRAGYADYANYPFGMPRWRGEPVAGKRILVHAEQGFGDTLQCARFLSRLAEDRAEVDIFCQPALVPLMQRIPGVSRALGTLDERPTHDFHAPIIDVAAHYLRSVDAPHWFGAYITPLAERVERWKPLLAGKAHVRVGLAWKGSAKQVNDRMRSLTPELAVRLTELGRHATFVNLQAGESPPTGARWIDAGSALADWDDTVAVIDQLDLVIGVDTAVVHVAGAMGKPVWTLRWFSPDWRWGASGETTRWYPSMRLFWQDRPGEWEPVLQRAARALAEF